MEYNTLEQQVYLLNELKKLDILLPTPTCTANNCQDRGNLMVCSQFILKFYKLK